MHSAGDSEDVLDPASSSVDSCAGVEPEPNFALRRRLARIGMPDTEPARFVVTESRRRRAILQTRLGTAFPYHVRLATFRMSRALRQSPFIFHLLISSR
jgi:hypothetical protein